MFKLFLAHVENENEKYYVTAIITKHSNGYKHVNPSPIFFDNDGRFNAVDQEFKIVRHVHYI